MLQSNREFQQFIETAVGFVRCKRAHGALKEELAMHLADQKTAFLQEGLGEEDAIQKTVESMGDPELIGQQLNMAHRPRAEWPVILLTVIAVASGLFIHALLGINSPFADYLLPVPLGIALFFAAYYFDYTVLVRYAAYIYTGLLILCAVSFFFPPLEFLHKNMYSLTLLLIPCYAGLLYRLRGKGCSALGIAFGAYLVPAWFCLFAPSSVGFAFLTAAALILLTAAVLRGWFIVRKAKALVLIYAMIFSGPLLLLATSPSAKMRLGEIFALNPLERGYIPSALRELLSQAQVFGGIKDQLFQGQPLAMALPWKNDLMLAYLIARFGYAAGIALILLVALLLVCLFVAAFRQKTQIGFVVSFSVSLIIACQSLLYVLTNFGLLYVSAALPLISFGAANFVISLVLMGLALSVYRNNFIVWENPLRPISPRWRLVVSFERETVSEREPMV